MIPTFDVQICVRVDTEKIRLPPWGLIHWENGLFANRNYEYMKGIGWKLFKETYELENKAINYLDSISKDKSEFEKNLDFLYQDETWRLQSLRDLDLGIASTVFGLYAFGCFPITSCRGHVSGAGEKHPLVVFYARPDRVSYLIGAAAGSGVGLVNHECERNEGLIVYSSNVLSMQRFAKALHVIYPSIRIFTRNRTKHEVSPEVKKPKKIDLSAWVKN